jgi:hypothetical protein
MPELNPDNNLPPDDANIDMSEQRGNSLDVAYPPTASESTPSPSGSRSASSPHQGLFVAMLAFAGILFILVISLVVAVVSPNFSPRRLVTDPHSPVKSATPTIAVVDWTTPPTSTNMPKSSLQLVPTSSATLPPSITDTPELLHQPVMVPSTAVSDLDGNAELKIFSGHAPDCSQSGDDVWFVGTEEVKFTTCLPHYAAVSQLYLFANKPLSRKESEQDKFTEIFETSIPPTDSQNVLNSTFHARVSLSNNDYHYYGFDMSVQDMRTLNGWNIGGISPRDGNYVYINKQGGDSANFQDGNSRMRWKITDISTSSDYLMIEWVVQILDITILNDERYSYEYGVGKNLEFYSRINDHDWQGPVASLRRRGDFLYSGIENGKEHTVFKDGNTYHLISMDHSDNLKTYYDYTFNLERGADGRLTIKNLSDEDKTLSTDFDIRASSDFCQLAAPHLTQENSQYVLYYAIFGKEGSNNCQGLGTQYIYKTSSDTLHGGLSLHNSVPVLEYGRDPWVKGEIMYYADALEPRLMAKNLRTDNTWVVFAPGDYILWPESPSVLDYNGYQYLFFHNAFAATNYLVQLNGTWYYRGYLSLPRTYEWEELDEATGSIKRKFLGLHWGGEFWLDSLGNPTREYVLSSFQSVHCSNPATKDCTPYPISFGYVNFDLYDQPYMAVQPLDKPAGLDSDGLRRVVPTPVAVPTNTPVTTGPIIEISADRDTITEGECALLRWNIQNVREVYLNEAGEAGQGEIEVCPTETTNYTWLIVKTDGTRESREVTITVNP